MKTGSVTCAVAALGLLTGCVSSVPAPAPMASVTGTAFYRERIALPPGAELEVVLEDVSVRREPAFSLVSVRQQDIGQPPYGFELVYDPRRIVPSRDYAVRASITLEDRLLFATDTPQPVITHGNPTSVELLLKRVATAAGRNTGGEPGDLYATLPASFEGVLPCADCEGIDFHLDFFPDGAYFLRTEYLGRKEATYYDVGRYALSTDGITLVLKGGDEPPLFFSIEDANTLRKLDQEGRPIDSQHSHELRRAPGFSPVEPALAMRGMFRYMADAAGFVECRTGRSMPVAMEGGYIDLERAYLEADLEPGAPVMALVEGRIARRMPMEGPGPVPTLVVDRFAKLAAGEECPPRFTNAPLQDTYWRLIEAGGETVVLPEGQPEAHLVLRAEDGRAAGSDGCNRIVGGYTLEGSNIRFSQMASTMMACPGGMDVAVRLAAALDSAVRWRIIGRLLELYDAGDVMVARLEAR